MTPEILAAIAAVTLASAIVATIFFKGFFNTIPILIGLVTGYLFTFIMGRIFPAYDIISFVPVAESNWFRSPSFILPKFAPVPVITFLLVSFATIAEHLGDTLVMSKVVGRDFYKNPGLHRTLLGDGLATFMGSSYGRHMLPWNDRRPLRELLALPQGLWVHLWCCRL